jgi:hypothetical protein
VAGGAAADRFGPCGRTQQLGIGADHGQQIVEIVRDAAGQLPDRLETVGMAQRRFRLFPFGDFALEPAIDLGQGAGSLLDLHADAVGIAGPEQEQPAQQRGAVHAGAQQREAFPAAMACQVECRRRGLQLIAPLPEFELLPELPLRSCRKVVV